MLSSVPGLSKLARFAKKQYRDGYLQSAVKGGIAYQIQALRAKFGLTQSEFAEKTGKKQSVISRLENTEYGRVTIQTLLDIASGLDVALVVRFVSYPDFLKCASNMSPSALQPDTIYESLASGTQSSQSPYSGLDFMLVSGQPGASHNLDLMPRRAERDRVLDFMRPPPQGPRQHPGMLQ